MSEGVAEELVLKVGVKVDDSQYVNLKEDIKKNKQDSMAFKLSSNEKITSSKSISEKEILESNLKQSKKYLIDIINSKDDSAKFALSKDKAQEYLSKILEVEKKSANSLENLLTTEMENKKDSSNKEKFSAELASGGFIAAIVGALFYAQKQVLNVYSEKLSRDLDLSKLSTQTGETTENMARLNYQAKNVGLSLDQIVHSATNFATDIFTGKDQDKMALYGALGVNPIQDLKKIRTPEDAIKYQLEIFKKAQKGFLNGGNPEFLANQQAASLAGIPANEILSYENFGTKKNKNLALETKKFRGEIGSSSSVINNFEDLTASLQNSTASIDNLLSRGDIAKRISLQSADITTKTVNLINATLNITGVGDSNSKFTKIMEWGGGNENKPDFLTNKPSSSAQVKSGG
jgi:hypothetical protein